MIVRGHVVLALVVSGFVASPASGVTVVAPTSRPVVAVPAKVALGAVVVSIKTPAGVPANVVLAGKSSATVSKGAAGRVSSPTVSLPPGRYKIKPQRIEFQGRLSLA